MADASLRVYTSRDLIIYQKRALLMSVFTAMEQWMVAPEFLRK